MARVINIAYRADTEIGRVLSNLAHTPFVMDGEEIASLEAFYQATKYDDEEVQREILVKFGPKAKQAGKRANQRGAEVRFWKGKEMFEDSDEFTQLLRRAVRAKFQNPVAGRALIMSGDAEFTHNLSSSTQGVESFRASRIGGPIYELQEELKASAGGR